MLKSNQSEPLRVTVCVDATKTLGRVVFQAVIDYIRRMERNWVLESAAGNRLWLPAEAERLPLDRLDGVISFAASESIARKMKKAGVQFVGVLDDSPDSARAVVLSDDNAIGRLAASHLVDLSLKNFAYYGTDLVRNSETRFRGFAAFLDDAKLAEPAHIKARAEDIMSFSGEQRSSCLRRLGRELLDLTHDGRDALGVFAYGDSMALTVIEACREVGLVVPDMVAVLAVAMDEIICELSNPPLSSIQQDARKIGQEAAAMLDSLLQGKEPESRRIVVAPLNVNVRTSTNCVATEDRYVRSAVRLIRERFRGKLNVGDLCTTLNVSRRLLEDRFQRALGRAPYEEILRTRLRYAETLLAQTQATNLTIALEAGFGGAASFEQAFLRTRGVSPREYRKKFTGAA